MLLNIVLEINKLNLETTIHVITAFEEKARKVFNDKLMNLMVITNYNTSEIENSITGNFEEFETENFCLKMIVKEWEFENIQG